MLTFKAFVKTPSVVTEVARSPERAAKLIDDLARRYPVPNMVRSQDPTDQNQVRPPIPYSGISHQLDYNIHHPSVVQKIVEVPIDKIRTDQPSVSAVVVRGKLLRGPETHAAKYSIGDPGNTEYLPQMIHHDGHFHIMDGNHRVTTARLKGEKTIRAIVHYGATSTEATAVLPGNVLKFSRKGGLNDNRSLKVPREKSKKKGKK